MLLIWTNVTGRGFIVGDEIRGIEQYSEHDRHFVTGVDSRRRLSVGVSIHRIAPVAKSLLKFPKDGRELYAELAALELRSPKVARLLGYPRIKRNPRNNTLPA